jgi:cyclic pyranopterin phosphate synthase
MRNAELPWEKILEVLDDADRIGVDAVRIYGGEPLVHPSVVGIIEYAVAKRLRVWISTNGFLLRDRIDDLHAAGLRAVGIPLYGTGRDYDKYVQRPGAFERLIRGLDYTRSRFGESIRLVFSWLIAEPFCSVQALDDAITIARAYGAEFRVDLVHSKLPYFTLGPNECLRIRDGSRVGPVVTRLVQLRQSGDVVYGESKSSILSIPDWIRHDTSMEIPCDMYDHLWIGPDGSVQLCYASFPLGNIYEARLAELVYTKTHVESCRAAFQLKCPRCHCNRPTRIVRHMPSVYRYGFQSIR